MFADVTEEMGKLDLDISVEEYNDIVFVGRKEEPCGPHREYQTEWFFRGFCTYREFKDQFAEAYGEFQEEYGDYNFCDEDGCDVYLEVSGAILLGFIVKFVKNIKLNL